MEMSEIFDYLNKNSGALTVLFTAVVTAFTIAYALLTWKLVSETKKMREVQTEPTIEITIKSLDFAVNLARLHVRNIGLGPAKNVNFTPRVISGGKAAQALLDEFTQTNFFKVGLKYFGPGQERVSHFTQMSQGYDEKVKSVLAIDISYEGVTGVKYHEQATIDMSELKGEYQLGAPDLHSIAKSLEKIQGDFSHISSGFKKINANVYTSEDRAKEQQEQEEWIASIEQTKQQHKNP